ncbi:Dihydroceramide delta(4)-desaturase [Leucoagaricus sp. SymC.cos]|nr:Dihydroceramide delta(4)-desaturase [Leucoagaricus sp. SymC.cos]
MKKHAEVTKLMGYEPLTTYIVFGVVALQIAVSVLLAKYHVKWSSPLFIILAYVIGGTANHNLFLAIHEITVWQNKTLAIFANLPTGIPYAAAFKKYHIEHHKFLGQDGIDTDLPTNLELYLLNNILGKVFFATSQILFYTLRPTFVRAQTLTSGHFLNILAVLASDYAIYTLFSSTPLMYFLFSSFFAGSLHPCAGHFIAEHYLWDGQDQETYSYYSW